MVDATVTLYKDIGLDSNYNRTMLFDTKAQQTNWFNSISTNLKLTLTNVNYNKIQNALYVHEQFGDIYGYSYVRLQNIDDSGRTYYGFISGVTLVDDETTRFDIVIDTIQTFMCEWELGNCMVYKEHIDRWSNIGSEVRYVRPNSEGVNTYYTSNTPQLINYGVTDERRDILVGVVAFTSDRDYTTYGSNKIMFNNPGLYRMAYLAKWFKILPTTDDDYELDCPDDILECIPTYIASQLYKIDDEVKSSILRNEWEMAISRIDENDYSSNKIIKDRGEW